MVPVKHLSSKKCWKQPHMMYNIRYQTSCGGSHGRYGAHPKTCFSGRRLPFNTGNARRAWLLFGCHWLPEERLHRFVVWAPNARSVSLVGDFNGWDVRTEPMRRCNGGIWCVFVPDLTNGSLYKFAITGADGKTVLKSDPFAAWSETGVNTASKVWNSGGYDWQDRVFMESRARKAPHASHIHL